MLETGSKNKNSLWGRGLSSYLGALIYVATGGVEEKGSPSSFDDYIHMPIATLPNSGKYTHGRPSGY